MNMKSNPHNLTYKLLIAIFVAVIFTFSVIPVYNHFRGRDKDYGKFYSAGQIVLQGGDIYIQSDNKNFDFMYPPPAAVFFALLSVFGLLPFIVILGLINSISWVASILLSMYLITGKALRQHPFLYAAPAACCAPYVWDIYALGQPNLLLLACMLGAFACLQLRKEWHTGALIALAAAIKAFPVLSIIYLVYRRRWKAALSTIAFLCFFLMLLPVPFRGFQRNLQDLKIWSAGMVFHYEADTIAQRSNRGYSMKNQSLIAVANRLLRPVKAFELKKDSSKEPFYVNFINLQFAHINAIIIIFSLGLCLFYLASMPRYAQMVAYTNALEYAMLLLLILIFTPLSFDYFYVWLLYPLMAALNILLTAKNPSQERSIIMAWLIACVILLSLMLPIPGFEWPRAIGNTFWACVLMLFGLGLKLKQLKSLPAQVIEYK